MVKRIRRDRWRVTIGITRSPSFENAMTEAIERFNKAAMSLQSAEFRVPRTPGEWQRLHKNPPERDYSKLLNAVVPFLEAFRSASPPQRSGIGVQLTRDSLGILRTFAHSAAILAVRQASPALIIDALSALAVLGDVDDAADLTFYMATIHYAALKLGLDTQRIFGDAARLSAASLVCDRMQRFPLLPPSARDLANFNLREVISNEGFDIVQN